MCDPVTLAVAGFAGTWALNYATRADKEKDKAINQMNKKIDSINQNAQERVEENKLASSVQSTDPTMNDKPTLQDKLATQKVPLNTTNTGLAVGNGLSTGLNLGGY
jgi:hypothetical protein